MGKLYAPSRRQPSGPISNPPRHSIRHCDLEGVFLETGVAREVDLVGLCAGSRPLRVKLVDSVTRAKGLRLLGDGFAHRGWSGLKAGIYGPGCVCR